MHKLKLVLELRDRLPGIVSDARAFSNLLSNAVKYTRRGSIVVSATVRAGGKAPSPGRWIAVELAAIPGVTGVTSSLVPLLAGSNWSNDVSVQGFQSGPDIDSNSNMNEAFANKFGLGTDAVGKFMGIGRDSLHIQIVGLVRNAKYSDVKDEIPPVYFLPWRQDSRVGNMNYYVRTPQSALVMANIRTVMKRIDAGLPIEDLKTMPQQIRENIFLDRMISILSAAFAVLAMLLAGIGLYGVLAYTVAQRTREIGVRMAIGADSKRVKMLVLRQVGVMTVIGAIFGIAGAFAIGRAAQSLLYGMPGHDPLGFGLAVVVLAMIALLAGSVPAHRAAQVDPMNALRYD